MKNNIVLIGFMGTGKTSAGRLLGIRLKRPFIDTDKKIEHDYNMAVAEIFKERGEEGFRLLESEIIAKVATYTNTIIATGGGAVLRAENMEKLRRNGVIIALTARPEVIVARTTKRGAGTRPLLNCSDPAQAVAELLCKREKLYSQADYLLDTGESSPQEVVEQIVIFLRQGGYLRGRS